MAMLWDMKCVNYWIWYHHRREKYSQTSNARGASDSDRSSSIEYHFAIVVCCIKVCLRTKDYYYQSKERQKLNDWMSGMYTNVYIAVIVVSQSCRLCARCCYDQNDLKFQSDMRIPVSFQKEDSFWWKKIPYFEVTIMGNRRPSGYHRHIISPSVYLLSHCNASHPHTVTPSETVEWDKK